MKQEKFEELLESVRQGGEILRGKTKPSRSFKVKIPEVQNLMQHPLPPPRSAAVAKATLAQEAGGRDIGRG